MPRRDSYADEILEEKDDNNQPWSESQPFLIEESRKSNNIKAKNGRKSSTFRNSIQCFSKYTKSISRSIYTLGQKQSFFNFILKFTLGLIGGIIVTYFFLMFFLFQLSLSLNLATTLSTIIGVLLTLGLIFSNKIRCLAFLIIPQFFSRVGTYTLTCYALILILTGPAANTLRNTKVLSQSMICGYDMMQSNEMMRKGFIRNPHDIIKDAARTTMGRMSVLSTKINTTVAKLEKLVKNIANNIEHSLDWLQLTSENCNKVFSTPKELCENAIAEGIKNCKAELNKMSTWLCDVGYIKEAVCGTVIPVNGFCQTVDFNQRNFASDIIEKFQAFSNNIKTMLQMAIHVHHPSDNNKNADYDLIKDITGNDSDPILIWLCISVCVTGLFFLLIVYRATYYEHMFQTRTQFDNRYVTKELRDINNRKLIENKQIVLPLHKLEKDKYIDTFSCKLVTSEKRHMSRSILFMAVTTMKLLIHIVADYSLYWVLTIVQSYGRSGKFTRSVNMSDEVKVTGQGYLAHLLKSLLETFDLPQSDYYGTLDHCLPKPNAPDMQRYFQIGILIVLLWVLAICEPYGLRLRHKIMEFYKPSRAKARAQWLYNHIIKSRGGYLKFARRKLHRTYKYSEEEKLTFRYWIQTHVPFVYIFKCQTKGSICVLCEEKENSKIRFNRCSSLQCPGIYCETCYKVIGYMCTVCVSPIDYGDLSDVSLEEFKENSDDSESCGEDDGSDSSKTIFVNKMCNQINIEMDDIRKHKKKLQFDSDLDNDSINNTQSLDLLIQEYREKIKKHRKETAPVNYEICAKKIAERIMESSDTEDDKIQTRFLSRPITNKAKGSSFRKKSNMDKIQLIKIHETPKILSRSHSKRVASSYRRIDFSFIPQFVKKCLSLGSTFYEIKRNGSKIEITKHIKDKTVPKKTRSSISFSPLSLLKNMLSNSRFSVRMERKLQKNETRDINNTSNAIPSFKGINITDNVKQDVLEIMETSSNEEISTDDDEDNVMYSSINLSPATCKADKITPPDVEDADNLQKESIQQQKLNLNIPKSSHKTETSIISDWWSPLAVESKNKSQGIKAFEKKSKERIVTFSKLDTTISKRSLSETK